MTTPLAIAQNKSTWLIPFTWAVVLLASDLPNAIWQALIGVPPAWLFWIKTGLLLALVLASLAWRPLDIVRSYFGLLLVLMLALWGMNWLRGTESYLQWEQSVGWVVAMAGYQLLKLLVVAIMLGVLWLMGKKKDEYFFTPGQLKTPINTRPSQAKPGRRVLSWGALGLILGICIAPLTLLFFGIGNLPSSSTMLKVLPYIPAALLFAATNAFAEEVQFRASLLDEAQKVVGPDQAIWLTAAFFGFAHYFGGAPSGIPGVLIAGLLGAMFAKLMLGSRGIAAPWFVHFCQNAVIYTFWAIGSVA